VTSDAGHRSVLIVCTGNICRSPAAELFLRAGLGAASGIAVASAGLQARAGEPVAAPVAALLRAWGVDPIPFRARQLVPALVQEADLVLTMTAAQRAAVIARAPDAVRRTFTLVEFADLAGLLDDLPDPAGPSARLVAVVARAGRARALRQRDPAQDDDIDDPFGRSDDVHARVLASIAAAVERLLGSLVPAARSRSVIDISLSTSTSAAIG
jgi:protein-tyrosine phosphatase